MSRIHQRIADGSLVAERIGSQWVVDERSLLHVQERSKAGRPYSARSAWAVIAASEDDRDRVGVSGPAVSARARMQLKRLLELAAEPVADEEVVRQLVVSLRSVFRNRAQRRLLRAAPADLVDLRADDRWAMLVDLGASGIASPVVEGYLGESDVDGVVKDYLLVEADGMRTSYSMSSPTRSTPTRTHGSGSRPISPSIAGRARRPRAAELLHELAMEWKAGER